MKFGNEDSVASASHGIVPEHRAPPGKVLPERKKSIEEAETSKFQEFKKLIHAATRPLPTETGDGSYIEDESSGGLWADFRALGMKDASTLVSMLENKLSGAFVDDKTMMMEHIIQVRNLEIVSAKMLIVVCPAGQPIARRLEDAVQIDQFVSERALGHTPPSSIDVCLQPKLGPNRSKLTI